jgi:glucose-6-phosphate isomerase
MTRECLKVTHSSLPGFGAEIPGQEAVKITAKMEEWNRSSYAGFRRLLEHGSDCHPDLKAIRNAADSHRAGGTGRPIRDCVILGIGGSSLGAEAIVRALHPALREPRFHVADNSDPTAFRWLLNELRADETLFYVVAKSGGTPETLSQFLVALDWVRKTVPGDAWKRHFVLCTDPQKGDLRALAQRWKLSCLDVPPAVGGRFSVLTPVGLFPAAFAGLPIEDFLRGASSVAHWDQGKQWSHNPCAQVAISLAKAAKEKPITVLMPYTSQLGAFSRWFCQLWAESLGKGGHGLTPYPAVGATDQHSQMQLYMEGPKDKCLVFVHLVRQPDPLPIPSPPELLDLPAFTLLQDRSVGALLDAEFRATRDAVTQAAIPNCTLEVDALDAYSLGALFYFWEMATAVAGAVLGVNPFDQPGVEAAKVLTKKYLSRG